MDQSNSTQGKKTQILEATTRLLVERGVQALSFEGIAHQAGMSRQLVRYYYTDLETLMCDLCDGLGQSYQDALVKGILKVGQVNRLGFFLDFFFGVSGDSPMPDNLEAYDAMFAFAVGSPRMAERMRAQYKVLGQVMVHELAIAHPGLDASACEELSFLFVSAMHAHWSFVASLGYSRAHNQLARDAFGRVIASYVAAPPETQMPEKPWSREN